MSRPIFKSGFQVVGCHPGAGPSPPSPEALPGWQPINLSTAARHYLRLYQEARLSRNPLIVFPEASEKPAATRARRTPPGGEPPRSQSVARPERESGCNQRSGESVADDVPEESS
jgi:hypothetical protein